MIEIFNKITKENQHPIRDTSLAFLTIVGISLVVDFGLAGIVQLILITNYDHPIFYTKTFAFIISNHEFFRLGIVSIIGLIIYKKMKLSDAYRKAFLLLFFFGLIVRVFFIIFE